MNPVISIAQMDVHLGDPARNLAQVASLTAEAARRGSHLVIFPELWDTSYALNRAADLATPLDDGRFSRVSELAASHSIHIVGSMMEAGTDGKAYNTAVWFAPDGSPQGIYRKLHLFRLMNEEKYLHSGDVPLLLDLPWGKTGVAICYDLRFPELFRHYALNGAVLTVIPAQWPHPRMAHWTTLLRARAIENQMAIAACNRVGDENDATFGGRSVLLNAWGDAVIEGGERPALLTATLDLSHVERVRRKIPVFEDRRPDIY